MGTQQILMIVLSVIVVGSAVAVGIEMFDTQSKNLTRAAIISDIIQMGINVQAYIRTPVIYGGAGNVIDNVRLPRMMSFINSGNENSTINSTNGPYVFEDPGTNSYIDFTMATIPTITGWTVAARIFYDARTDVTNDIEKGIWLYVGPISNLRTPPSP